MGGLFLPNLLAPGALAALGTLEVAGRSHVHGVERLRVGRHDLVTAVFSLVSAHADFKLQSVEARDQEHNARSKYCH